jgi:LacI family transcriptional regulator
MSHPGAAASKPRVMNKKLSIHDIARQLKVSAATVSYVLNGKAEEKRISKALEKKIIDYADKQGYRPNMLAKSLRTGKSKVIAMLVEGIDDPFFSSISRIVEKGVSNLGYKIFFASTENDPRIARELIGAFRGAQVEGYIIAPPPGIEKTILSLMNEGIPVILFDRYYPKLKTLNVVVDNLGGAYQAVRHFMDAGYSHIGLVTLVSSQVQMVERLKGYKKALSEHARPSRVLKISFDLRREQRKMTSMIKEFIRKNPELDAILFATNYLAISGLEAINELKLSIPGDIAVIGFDDNTHFSLFKPAVTAVAQPVQRLSEEVVAQLMNSLNAQPANHKTRTIRLPTELVVRQSSHPVAGRVK